MNKGLKKIIFSLEKTSAMRKNTVFFIGNCVGGNETDNTVSMWVVGKEMFGKNKSEK